MKLKVVILLAVVQPLYSQLYAIANGGIGAAVGGAVGCPGYLRFAGRAALQCCNPNQQCPPCCPCPGAAITGTTTTPSTFILNACVPACCPNSVSNFNPGFGGIYGLGGTGMLGGGIFG